MGDKAHFTAEEARTTVTAKIVRAHLNEFPDYYTRLAKMETEAEAYWAGRGE
jgi:hypothetical protein